MTEWTVTFPIVPDVRVNYRLRNAGFTVVLHPDTARAMGNNQELTNMRMIVGHSDHRAMTLFILSNPDISITVLE